MAVQLLYQGDQVAQGLARARPGGSHDVPVGQGVGDHAPLYLCHLQEVPVGQALHTGL